MALLQAYAQRCFAVAPITRSASSRNGTSVLLPYTSDVEAMTTFFFFLLACFSTTSVPCTLVSIVCTGCSTISLTPTAAAKWKITSLRSISSASSGSFVSVSMTYLNRGFAFRWPMLRIEPVDRLSMMSTSCPSFEQRLGEMRSDETCAAGDQRSHEDRFLSNGRRRPLRTASAAEPGYSGSDSTSAGRASCAAGTRPGRVDAKAGCCAMASG